MLEILYQDVWVVAINKPPGLLVHRSPIACDVQEFAVQLLRDQLGQRVYPVHRLDRKTSGILLFALDEKCLPALQRQFSEKTVEKVYWAVVRGFAPDVQTIDYPLRREDGLLQEAVTHFRTVQRSEIPVPFGKHATSRYSLVEVRPQTGRMHQIRKHFAHIFHPIIGDRPHGCNKQNRLFLERWQLTEMLLHARSLSFRHPVTEMPMKLQASLFPEFERMLFELSFTSPTNL